MDFPDRRKSERLSCKVPVLCRKGTMFDNSQTMNISEGGIGFFSQRFIPVNTNMILEISLSPKADPLLTIGKVKWIQKVGYMDRYKVGMEFIDMSKSVRERLIDTLRKNFRKIAPFCFLILFILMLCMQIA